RMGSPCRRVDLFDHGTVGSRFEKRWFVSLSTDAGAGCRSDNSITRLAHGIACGRVVCFGATNCTVGIEDGGGASGRSGFGAGRLVVSHSKLAARRDRAVTSRSPGSPHRVAVCRGDVPGGDYRRTLVEKIRDLAGRPAGRVSRGIRSLAAANSDGLESAREI